MGPDVGDNEIVELLRLLSSSGARAEQIRALKAAGRRNDANDLLTEWLHRDEDKTIAIQLAAEFGDSELNVNETLLSETEVDIYILISSFTLHQAARNGCLAIVKVLVNYYEVKKPDAFQDLINGVDQQRWKPLHYACQGGHTEVVKLLLKVGAKNSASHLKLKDQCEALDERMPTPLHLSIQPFDSKGSDLEILSKGESRRRAKLVQAILGSPEGADMLNSRDAEGNTPLHLAVKTMNVEVVEELVQQPRLVAVETNNEGKTPSHLAADQTRADPTKSLPNVKIIKKYLARLHDVQDREEEERQIREELASERARHFNAANAILVGGALLVSVTFQSNFSDVQEPDWSTFKIDCDLCYQYTMEIFRGSNNMSFYLGIITMIAAIRLFNSRKHRCNPEDEMKHLRNKRMFTSLYLTASTIYAILAFITGGILTGSLERVASFFLYFQLAAQDTVYVESLLSNTTLTSTLMGLFLFIPFILVPYIYENLRVFKAYLDTKFLWLVAERSKGRPLFTFSLMIVLMLILVPLICLLAFGFVLPFIWYPLKKK